MAACCRPSSVHCTCSFRDRWTEGKCKGKTQRTRVAWARSHPPGKTQRLSPAPGQSSGQSEATTLRAPNPTTRPTRGPQTQPTRAEPVRGDEKGRSASALEEVEGSPEKSPAGWPSAQHDDTLGAVALHAPHGAPAAKNICSSQTVRTGPTPEKTHENRAGPTPARFKLLPTARRSRGELPQPPQGRPLRRGTTPNERSGRSTQRASTGHV